MLSLHAYLTSPKFHEDTTVQVDDVLSRIQEMQTAASQVDGHVDDDDIKRVDRDNG